MGLPKPLGPLRVSIADFELRRKEEGNGGDREEVLQEEEPHPPLFRVYYPTAERPSPWGGLSGRFWLPHIMYMYGYCCIASPPVNIVNKFKCWVAAVFSFCIISPLAIINAAVGKPPLPPNVEGGEGPRKDGRLPVVLFSHGLWSMRTTYSTFCCDLASHGYVVIVPEHLDGSASMARSSNADGTVHWHIHEPLIGIEDVPLDTRVQQQQRRIAEMKSILHLLERINAGSIPDSSNALRGKEALRLSLLTGRLDLEKVAIAGHSFGAVTSALFADKEPRVGACLALDAWWTPLVDAGVHITAASCPLLIVNNSEFGGAKLRNARDRFLAARKAAYEEGKPLATDILIVKGSRHQDQSDLPLIFPWLTRKVGASGKLGGFRTRLITSRACLEFLHRNFLSPGAGAPYDAAYLTESDKENTGIETF